MLNGKLFGEAHLLNINTIISYRNDVVRQSFFELVWNSLTFPRAKKLLKKVLTSRLGLCSLLCMDYSKSEVFEQMAYSTNIIRKLLNGLLCTGFKHASFCISLLKPPDLKMLRTWFINCIRTTPPSHTFHYPTLPKTNVPTSAKDEGRDVGVSSHRAEENLIS